MVVKYCGRHQDVEMQDIMEYKRTNIVMIMLKKKRESCVLPMSCDEVSWCRCHVLKFCDEDVM